MEKEIINEEEFETERLTPTFWFLCILIISLLVVSIIQCVQLSDLIKSFNEVSDILQKIPISSENFKLNNELKQEYLLQIIKSIFIIISEVTGVIISGITMYKIRKTENQKEN